MRIQTFEGWNTATAAMALVMPGKKNTWGNTVFLGCIKITPRPIFLKQMDASQNDQYRLFEHLVRKSSQQILTAFKEELDAISQEEFGLGTGC
jgi:hypothetical protein